MTILASLYHHAKTHGFEFDHVHIDLPRRWVGSKISKTKGRDHPQLFEFGGCCIPNLHGLMDALVGTQKNPLDQHQTL